ncbi:hypothetical protein BCR22_12885 [Enterococcus plantarum]|uniref:Uncharacterized protein n=1 Tax=Enterococcus plantarum TaxID=1077675 RepID=A0A2W3ZUD8_9ENTE|nr:hypothetical protein [Enterococcus plantarum]OEG17695.1 hypothetical protein BCR22_12885 [Enterococcus plantarum]PZL77814.1 hypothetical protein CI088_00775 [Enterococcus plantarum]
MFNKKVFKYVYITIFILWLIGIILTLNLMPIQDFGTLTYAQQVEAQKEYSIHYDLGILLIKISEVCFILVSLYLVFKWIIKRRN